MDQHDTIHQMIIDDLKEVKKDVKSLLALKYQIFGIVTGVSFVVTLCYNLILR